MFRFPHAANDRFEWDAPTAGFAACLRAPQTERQPATTIKEELQCQ